MGLQKNFVEDKDSFEIVCDHLEAIRSEEDNRLLQALPPLHAA